MALFKEKVNFNGSSKNISLRYYSLLYLISSRKADKYFCKFEPDKVVLKPKMELLSVASENRGLLSVRTSQRHSSTRIDFLGV